MCVEQNTQCYGRSVKREMIRKESLEGAGCKLSLEALVGSRGLDKGVVTVGGGK